ncbi:MAG: DUF2971 domain-containing protein [Bacteroidaceae bacterium]|nr:DUF2971 domain-containing protein [Bacteroidaceae bacterium]
MTLSEIEKDYAEFCAKDPLNFTGRASKLWDWCKALIQNGNREEAWAKSLDAFYFSFLDGQRYDGYEVFSFRSFDNQGYALKDIKNETMSLVHPDMFNDPFDTVIMPWLRKRVEAEKNELSKELSCMMLRRADALKARCFVRTSPLILEDGTHGAKEQKIEEVSPLMWAHYTDSHKGFCIKYTLDDKVIARDDAKHRFLEIKEILYRSNLDLTKGLLMNEALVLKSNDWNYEHEVRAILLDPDEKGMVAEVPAPKMSAIYLGLRCSTSNREMMVQALRDKDIPLYQMTFDLKNAGKLYPLRIG